MRGWFTCLQERVLTQIEGGLREGPHWIDFSFSGGSGEEGVG